MGKKKKSSQITSTLHLKFVFLYIIFGFIVAFTSAVTISGLVFNDIKESTVSKLYKNANIMATEFLPEYFNHTISRDAVQLHLKGFTTYSASAVWFIDREGNLIASSSPEGYPAPPATIQDFDPAEAGNRKFLEGYYHNYFDEKVITIIAPVAEGFSTDGYLLIHKSVDVILTSASEPLHTLYILIIILYLFSYIFLIAFKVLIFLPLQKISYAATQYALGNLDHVIPVESNDEMGYLSASLNYMASHLKDMEDYQKKFVANVSHDFRSPLTSIKGYVEAIVDGTIPPEMQEKYLKIVLSETERLTDLTKDLLTLNEFDNKELMLNCENFDLHEVIRSTAASFEGRCKSRKISIELVLAKKELEVTADRRKIQQVLYNLIDNAIKFSDDDSIITVETTERNDRVLTSVRDNGAGIPRDSVNKIFERFYKLDESRGKDKKGTGLGLAIVKEIIQAHNENINVISTEGVGTEFTFTLKKVV